MKMQFGDVTQPPNTQAKFSHAAAMLLLAWQPRPDMPWAEREWGGACGWAAGDFQEGRGLEGLPRAHHVNAVICDLVAQLCLFCDPMDRSPPGSVRGIFLADQDLDQNYCI